MMQARMYAELFVLYKENAEHIERVTIWAKADSHSWRAAGSPVLFDRFYEAKQAFWAVINPDEFLRHNPGPAPR